MNKISVIFTAQLLVPAICLVLSSCLQEGELPNKPTYRELAKIKRYDREGASLLYGVEIPKDKDLIFTSGQVAEVVNPDAREGSIEKYGDTYAQSISTFKKIDDVLKKAGLGMKDIIKLNVYIVPDPNKNGETDFKGFFDAYDKFFNNEANPNKVARTTLGVNALAREGLLIEIEAIAASD